ncbi:hypothetical protein Cmtc_59870 [Cupriavidus sp. TKC]|nr:hypothetical protein Cmtc_59870 [Cupriavidus sp. TKC]
MDAQNAIRTNNDFDITHSLITETTTTAAATGFLRNRLRACTVERGGQRISSLPLYNKYLGITP